MSDATTERFPEIGTGASALEPAQHQEILTLKSRYCFAVDATIQDPSRVDALLELMTDDVVLDYGAAGVHSGHEAVRRFYCETLTAALAWSFHSASNPVLTATDATHATGDWYVHAFGIYRAALAAGPQPVWGRYREEYVKTAAGWRIHRLKLLLEVLPTDAKG